MLILTNNPLAASKLADNQKHMLAFHPVTLRQVLLLARDMVHQGHRLLTHPLSGSVKPNETLYKSIGLSVQSADSLCFDSLRMAEEAIQAFDRFTPRQREITAQMDGDFQLVDWTLLHSALTSAQPVLI